MLIDYHSDIIDRLLVLAFQTGCSFPAMDVFFSQCLSWWSYIAGILDEIKAIFRNLWRMKLEFLISFSPFIMVFAAFVAFVRWNGSVVLGMLLSICFFFLFSTL